MGKLKKFVIAGIASILLVAAVVGVVVYTKKVNTKKDGAADQTTGSNQAVQTICAPTHYKETCEKTLAHTNTSDPKELIKLTFDAGAQNIGDVLKASALLKEAAADPRTKDAYKVCEEVLGRAVNDLKRSIEQVDAFDATRTDEYIQDLKVWLSAVLINQGTCLDAFEGTTGDAGDKMKNLLESAKQISINGLSMVADASSVLAMLRSGNIRKLSEEEPALAKRRLRRVPRQAAPRISLMPTIVVAKDGSGQFKTIGEAVAILHKKTNESVVIYVKAGVYEEYVEIPEHVNNVNLFGEGPLKTRITGSKSKINDIDTFYTATVAINGEDFFAKDIGFENTAGPVGHQAVALRVSADKAVFYNVHIDGYQDTLYAHDYRQYYRDCSISGTVDFVFGDATAIFQNCKFIVRKPGPGQACMVTAEGRDRTKDSVGAFVFQNSSINAEPAFLTSKPPHKAYLGRPWKELSRTIIMQSNIDGFIDPTGWAPWNNTNFALDTCYYAEYKNRGAGSNTRRRVRWRGIQKFTRKMAKMWTGEKAYVGDEWIIRTGVPYVPSLMQI